MTTTAAENLSGRWMPAGVDWVSGGKRGRGRALTRIIRVDEAQCSAHEAFSLSLSSP